MRTVGLKVLKNKLSEYVRLASQGETVLIADRDRVVAELVPPQPGRAETVSDAVLACSCARRWSRRRSCRRNPPAHPACDGEAARRPLAGLDADRTDR
jgi:antitoxin (DNA-binding transcriptional repressor) of toxin-antitoxin stability system